MTPCTRCSSKSFLVLPKFKIPEMDTTAEPDRVLPVVSSRQGVFFATDTAHGHFELWICEGCGIVQAFAKDIDAIRDLPDVKRKTIA